VIRRPPQAHPAPSLRISDPLELPRSVTAVEVGRPVSSSPLDSTPRSWSLGGQAKPGPSLPSRPGHAAPGEMSAAIFEPTDQMRNMSGIRGATGTHLGIVPGLRHALFGPLARTAARLLSAALQGRHAAHMLDSSMGKRFSHCRKSSLGWGACVRLTSGAPGSKTVVIGHGRWGEVRGGTRVDRQSFLQPPDPLACYRQFGRLDSIGGMKPPETGRPRMKP